MINRCIFAFSLTAMLCIVISAVASADQKTLECDWCTISYPDHVVPGQKFTVSVTTKTIPSGQKIGGDLHHAKVGKYLSFASWGGNPKPAQSNQTLVFNYTMPDYKADDQGIQPIFFLTTQGWNEATLKAFGPVILPLMNDEIRKTFRPDTATLKKSWICYGTPTSQSGGEPVWKSGEVILVPYEYYVDPQDDWGKTEIVLWVVGPWVDCPDGKYTTNRTHHNYSGCGVPNVVCEIGKPVKGQWKITLPKAYAETAPEKGKFGDSLLLIAQFRGNDKKNWPWQVRMGLAPFEPAGGLFKLDAPTVGNLFTYDQKVVMNVIPTEKGKVIPQEKLTWQVTDTTGQKIASGIADFPGKNGSTVELPINLTQKGTFLLRVELPKSAAHPQPEVREITFARIPDIEASLGTGLTRFGGQKFFGHPEAIAAARKLGFSTVRVWLNWRNLEPQRGLFNQPAWDQLHKDINCLKENNIRPWLLVDSIPAWAIADAKSYGGQFTALPIADADIERFITRASREFKDDIIGFEWQNEIVPGDVCADPVAEYLQFCRVADAASKRVNPKFKNQLAGGLWPQTYRQSLISAGIMDFTDILPIHYGNGSAVRGAQRDLASVGAQDRVALWDNETAKGISTWAMPLTEAMKDKIQSDYYFDRFPDELMTGCQHICIFGGEPSPAGDWSHFWSDMSPRPSAAALAVLINAIGNATPVGEFSVGKSDSIKLFQPAKRPLVMVVSSAEKGGETVILPVGSGVKVAKIDQQGNTTDLTVRNVNQRGVVSLNLSESAYLVEGGDPNVLKAQLIVSFPAVASGVPTYTVVKGNVLEIPLRFKNILDKPVQCLVMLDSQSGMTGRDVIVSLKPGEEVTKVIQIAGNGSKTGAKNLTGAVETALVVRFDDKSLPQLNKKIVVNTVEPDKIGNLLKNPGFEQADPKTAGAVADWNGTGRQGKVVPFDAPDEPGHEKFVYRFDDTKGKYLNIFQKIPSIPNEGGEYVYSFWIKSDDLATGSNFGGEKSDGGSWTWHWLQVFQAPKTQPYWQVFSKRMEIPDGTRSFTAAPVCIGSGWSMIDNAILVPYEGSEYTAFAPKLKKDSGKITVDGNLGDFDRSAPIPLMGQNQVRSLTKDYQWTPGNCSGVAWFNYDQSYLYVGIEVIDDKHVASQPEAACRNDDSVRIAIHPLNRLPGADSKAFCLDASSTAPGGSGKHTLYRPADFSGGLKSGSLAKDSSVYDIAVKRVGNHTYYEIAMPWSDLGVSSAVIGTKIGLSLQLTDNDGRGPQALILWGEGLYPTVSPISFGILTLTE